VSEHGSSVVRRAQLARELRRLRTRAGYSATEVVGPLGWPGSKLSRIERSQIGVKTDDLVLLLDFYGTEDPYRSELIALAEESRKLDRLGARTSGIRGEHVEFMQREAEAKALWNWEPLVIPGLLQRESYIRSIMVGWVTMLSEPPSYIDDRVEGRRIRQEKVMARDPPLELQFVIDESVLRRSFVDPSVMRDQLEHMAEISESPNVDIGILPLDGHHNLGVGAFVGMTFDPIYEVPVPDLVAFEHLTGTHFIDDPDETHKYLVAFNAMRESALGPAESRDLIMRVARDA
jgi:Domain of unknown function (DUF5753)/Helix-turn-helix domain